MSDWWRIDGAAVLTTSDPGVISDDPTGCKFSYGFAKEGTYQVELEMRDSTTGAVIGTKSREVIVQDWLIVSLGDSVASGEGNPDVPGGTSAQWEKKQCHRSSYAGPARAAAQIENADPKTSVTFVHLACSGARIDVGLLGPYSGIISGANLSPQVDAMKSLVGGREIDAALISIGANDVQFADVVTRCFALPFCDRLYPLSGASLFESRLTGSYCPSQPLPCSLPGKYGSLASRLNSLALPVAVPAKRYYITEYFDPTRDDTATPCGFPNGLLFDHPLASVFPFMSITSAEAAWASNNMMVRLNTAVTNAKALYGWTYVGGIRDAFLPHGYCATDHWVDRFRESQSLQGDQNGSLHPNHSGQNLYGAKIGGSLSADFYEGGDLTKPRPPAIP